MYISNLSQGGLALTGPHLDREGTVCEVSMTLPGHPDRLRLHGHISWIDTSSEIPTMGFCFGNLGREQRVALANFLLARFHNS